MNKILYILLSLIISMNIIADDFYVKTQAGIGLNQKARDEATKIKLKPNNEPAITAGVGYKLNKYLTADLSYMHNNPTLKGAANLPNLENNHISVKHDPKVKALLLSGYINAYSTAINNVYIGGGVGCAQVTDKVKVENSTKNKTSTAKSKSQTNLAYQLKVGNELKITDSLKFDFSYDFTDYGTTKSISDDPLLFKGKQEVKSHNFMIGARYYF